MRCALAHSVATICVVVGMVGCSMPSSMSSLNPFASKNKPAASTAALANAPQVPVTTPGYSVPSTTQVAPGYNGYASTQYPVTPYPTAGASPNYAPAGYAAPTGPTTPNYSNYTPANPGANPYATGSNVTNPYANAGMQPGNPYTAAQNSSYTAAQPYASPAPGSNPYETLTR